MKRISQKIVYEGKWLGLKETVFETRRGDTIVWESVIRKQSTVGMVVVAKLIPSNRFILIKQYRPALEGYVLGFPAGLAHDDIEHALVELKEETGYTGKIKAVSPVLKSNSGVINDSGRVVYVEVDEANPQNSNPIQELEESEEIEVLLVEKSNIKSLIQQEYEAGTHIGGHLWYLFVLCDVVHSIT